MIVMLNPRIRANNIQLTFVAYLYRQGYNLHIHRFAMMFNLWLMRRMADFSGQMSKQRIYLKRKEERKAGKHMIFLNPLNVKRQSSLP